MRIFKPKYQDLPDEKLMEMLSKGDSLAFNQIYERYANPLLRYFMRMLWKDREKAEDFVHDIFAKIIKNPNYFDLSRTFKTWIYAVANNMCKNEYKKQAVRKNTQNTDQLPIYVKDENQNVFNDVQDSFFKEAFLIKMDQLEIKHKEVFELRHFEGLSIKEIAEILEIAEGTIKSRLFYATKYLAEGLKEFNPLIM